MPIAAGISAVGAIASAGIGYMGAKSAAQTQADSQRAALAQQQQLYQQAYNDNKQSLAPWIDNGGKASYSLADLYGLGPSGAQGVSDAFNKFTSLPAYQFPLQQGMLALTRNLNAQGKTMSGAQLREAQDYGQGLASTYMMNNYVNPLQSISESGRQAASSLAGTGTSLAGAGMTSMGSTIGNIGTAQAGGIVGGTNALTGGVGNAASSLALYSYLGKNSGGLQTPSDPTAGGGGGWGSLSNWFTGGGGGVGG